MVYRIYVEKKAGLDNEARALLSEIRTFLGIDTVAFAALCSLLSLPAGQLMLFIREGLTKIIDKLWTTTR